MSLKCEVVHETKLTWEISHPKDSYLAQLVEHYSDDQEAVGSTPLGAIFDEIYFVLFNIISVR